MTTSGTYAFLPSVGSLGMAAFARIGVRRSEILTEHLTNMQVECNLMQALWANLGPTLWTIDLQTVALIQGTATYSVPAETVMMLDVYYSLINADGSTTDRIITPYSRTEYASVPNKAQQDSPTAFWFDRLIAPTFTLWPVPDGTTANISYYRFTQPQDANLTNATNPQIPFLWLDAYVAGLSHRLARIYAPAMEAQRDADAQKAYNAASMQGTENVPLFIAPQTSGYWRT